LDAADRSNADVKRAYYKLARVIHPDKCSHPSASDAMGVAASAHSTLSDSTRRAAYDLYASQVDVDDAGAETYAQWESKGGANWKHLPPWLVRGLNHRCVGPILKFFLLIAAVVAGALALALGIAYFAVHMTLWVACFAGCGGRCWPRYGEGARAHARRMERFGRARMAWEAEASYARGRGEDPPEFSAFVSAWMENNKDPEEEEEEEDGGEGDGGEEKGWKKKTGGGIHSPPGPGVGSISSKKPPPGPRRSTTYGATTTT